MFQQVVKLNKHLFKVGETADDCRCEQCENLELFLLSLRRHLIQVRKQDLTDFSVDHKDFIKSFVCSTKNRECCDESCHEYPGKEKLYEYINFIKDVDKFTYAQWGCEGNFNKKIQVHESGENAASAFSDLMCKNYKLHCYNTYRQYAVLNYLKKHLENNVILSIDFSRNYDNKQLHEIQSAYFGHIYNFYSSLLFPW